jgi:hypothetical protein
MTYREFTLPKKSGGTRRICAPDKALLKFQQKNLPKLEQLWDTVARQYSVEDVQHGFLTNRNCVTAATQHVGYQTTISMDISDFFDSVNTEHLARFSPAVAAESKYFHTSGYCAQGFATSPILANIAIIPALQEIDYHIHEYLSYPSVMTVYADDITISVDTEDYVETAEIIKTVAEILAKYNFRIKPTKTRIRYAKYGYRRVLGVMVGADHIKVPRKIKYKMRAARHQKNGSSLGGLTTWSRLLLPKALR